MDKQEFFEALRKVSNDNSVKVRKAIEQDENDELWNVVTTVYTFHPAISNVNGKNQIAELACLGGFGLLKAMIPEAEETKLLENERMKIQADIERLQDRQKEITGRISAIRTAWYR